MSIAYRDVPQSVDVEERRLIVDQSTVARTVLTDADVAEVEVLTVAAIQWLHAVTGVRRVGQISTFGRVQTWPTRARIKAGTPPSEIPRRARAEESTSCRRVVTRSAVEAVVPSDDTRVVTGVTPRPVVPGSALTRVGEIGTISTFATV